MPDEQNGVNKTLLILLIISVFALGFLTNTIMQIINEQPKDQISPGDHIKIEDVKTYDTQAIIMPNRTLRYSIFTNTKSMLPVLDVDHEGIEIIPENPAEIKIGDIISFTYENETIVHRVVGVKKDAQGLFWETRGDNLKDKDPLRIRYKDITGIVVAIIY